MSGEKTETETELRKEIAEIIKNGVTYSYQTNSVIIHGAIDQLVMLVKQEKTEQNAALRAALAELIPIAEAYRMYAYNLKDVDEKIYSAKRLIEEKKI